MIMKFDILCGSGDRGNVGDVFGMRLFLEERLQMIN